MGMRRATERKVVHGIAENINGNEVSRLHGHSHFVDEEKMIVFKIKTELKRRAQNTAENNRDVLNGAVAGQDEERLNAVQKRKRCGGTGAVPTLSIFFDKYTFIFITTAT